MAEKIANPIVTKLAGVAGRLKAIAVVDGPNDPKELELWRKLNGHKRLYLVSPTVRVADGNNIIETPASPYIAGVFARIKLGQSPSGQVINGILGTTVPISFEVDDPESTAQQYVAMQVSTIVREPEGFLVWGARGSGDPNDSKSTQIQKVRIIDAIEEALVTGTRWAVAAQITTDFIGSVVRKVEDYFRSLIIEGSIVGGNVSGDKERNTSAALANGDVYWKYEVTPTAVAETLHFEGFNTNKYYENFGDDE
jgi:phage tail sheath protein FI